MTTSNSNCLFCRIVRQEEPAHIVTNDGKTLAFLDVRPVFKGHVLIVPHDHHDNLLTCPPDVANEVFTLTQRIAIALKSALNADGVFVANNNVVSQSVPHLHLHAVPRNRKDGLRGFMWPRVKYDNPEEANRIAERIGHHL